MCHGNYSEATTNFVPQKEKSPKKPKIGRPKLPKGEAKSEIIRARVTPYEQKEIEQAAGSLGISEWARLCLISASRSS